MKGTFNDQGDIYTLYEKRTKFPLYNFHFNEHCYMTFANDMSGELLGLDPVQKIYNRHFRYCFIEDSEDLWSFGCAGEGGADLDKFLCEYRLASTVLQAQKNGIEVRCEAFVPIDDCGEYIIYRFQNLTKLHDDLMGQKELAKFNGRLQEKFSMMTPVFRHEQNRRVGHERVRARRRHGGFVSSVCLHGAHIQRHGGRLELGQGVRFAALGEM